MKLLFSTDWLMRKITADSDIETEAGKSLEGDDVPDDLARGKSAIVAPRNAVQLRIALGALVRQLRMRDGLTLSELAQRADISEEELRQVERNPSYTAGPRLLRNLSTFFGVSLNNLSQMSGATVAVERKLYNTAVEFAAHSDDISRLTAEQLEALEGFVGLLNDSNRQKAS
jgi:transcriptional regulator with XRE-family HTH domain